MHKQTQGALAHVANVEDFSNYHDLLQNLIYIVILGLLGFDIGFAQIYTLTPLLRPYTNPSATLAAAFLLAPSSSILPISAFISSSVPTTFDRFKWCYVVRVVVFIRLWFRTQEIK